MSCHAMSSQGIEISRETFYVAAKVHAVHTWKIGLRLVHFVNLHVPGSHLMSSDDPFLAPKTQEL